MPVLYNVFTVGRDKMVLGSTLCLLLLALVVSGFEERDETVYIIDNNDDFYSRHLHGGLQDTLRFTLRRTGRDIKLKLSENHHINGAAKMYVLTLNDDGIEELRLVPLQEDNSVGFYQDIGNHAAFAVMCEPSQTGPCLRTLSGSLVIEDSVHSLQPLGNYNDRRGLGGYFGIPHTLTRMVQTETEGTRFGADMKSVFNDYTGTSDKRRRRDRTANKQDVNNMEEELILLNRQSSITAYGVEVLLVIDYPIYLKFMELFQDEAMVRTRFYYTHIMNTVDLMFGSIQETDISFYVTISGYIVIESDNLSPWGTKLHTQDTELGDGLDAFTHWVSKRHDLLPPRDLATFITRFGEGRTLGMAWLDGACNEYGTSIVQDFDFYMTSSTVAHEIGHNLGALHDGDENNCSPDEYLMAAFAIYATETNSLKPWQFSDCSVTFFRDFMRYLGTDNCMLDRTVVWDEDEFAAHNSSLLGQFFTPQQQCSLIHSPDAILCPTEPPDNPAVICRGLRCKSPGSSCSRYVAAHGTPCGTDKHCFQGRCIAIGEKCIVSTVAMVTNFCKYMYCWTRKKITMALAAMATKLNWILKCVDRGFKSASCADLRKVLGIQLSQFCKDVFYECCQMCAQTCKTGTRFTRQACNYLVEQHGRDVVCRTFTRQCCSICGPCKINIETV